ncbi:hypothetical protein DFJ58DRAFT_839338 [Suillus subalutaceus]|uniref:uncharacterized protein n=1 Tax=Suillus subalutaceus TaxID=48586 RepID=UPI001B876F32|nr:uncharacterized protein DFJ58DRAFT_839338 [Suillus subalutaceus]KAG1862825.1 hypothetical protein DFJ58DRAFT_839338 [Suillus subalutaceus]
MDIWKWVCGPSASSACIWHLFLYEWKSSHISFHAGRSGNPTRSSTAPRRQLTQRTTQPIKYLVVIHPELGYRTVTTDFDRLFRELWCPVSQKIGSFLCQAESLGLLFKFEVAACSDEFAGPIFNTQLTNHLDSKGQRSALGAKLSSSWKSTEDVTHKDLAANADKLPIPSPHHDHRIVFVVPLEFIVTGPLNGQGLHLCLVPRLWNKNFHPDIHEENTEFICSDGCSEQSLADSDMDFDVPDFVPSTSADTTNVGASLFLAGPVSPVYRMVPLLPLCTATSTIVHPPVASQPHQQSPTAAVAAWRGRIAAAQTTMQFLLSDDPTTSLLVWPPPLVTDAVTGQLELSIAPAMDLYSMILEVDASAQITQLRCLPVNAQAELTHWLQCQVFFGNQFTRGTPDHIVYSSMCQAFDCLIDDHLTLCEHILTEDLSSMILEGMFGGHILSSPEQVIRLLVINVTPKHYLHGLDSFSGVSLVLNFQAQWNHQWGEHVGIHIHTCFYAVDVLLNETSMLIVNQEILMDTSISTDFDRWIHSCISGNAFNHYNTSAHY